MAKRLSTKEILEAARKGGAAKPADEAAPAEEPVAEAEAEAAVEEQEVAAEPSAAAPAAPAANVPTPSSLGRPLTLKEKLAAARAGGAPAPAATAPAAAKPKPAAQKPVAAAAAEEAAEAPAAAEAPRAVPPPAKPLGRPMTLAEKLAAARGGAAPAAAGAAPAAAKPAPAAKAPAAAAKTAARALPPLEKMSDPRDLAEAARQAAAKKAKEIAAEAAAKVPPKPAKAPAKPQTVPPRPSRELAGAGAGAGAAAQASRRNFFTSTLTWIIAGWITFTAAISAMTLMTVRFMFPNVLAEPPSTIKIGLPTGYDPEDVSDRFKAEWGFWVVRSTKVTGQDILYALQSICTHLGCPPNWLAAEQKFKCPCHGSGFYITGINFEGPAPRPLERFKVIVADDGQIIVDKSQKFQQELGQWADPDSFIPV